jgi:hypothetical protein
MKKLVYTSEITSIPIHFDIVIDFLVSQSESVVASEYKGFWVTDAPVIPNLPKELIDSQTFQDFEDFMESVTKLITDYHKLHIYYKNVSPDHAHYFGLLAKDDQNRIILDFDFTFRVANHRAHRTPESEYNKQEQEEALNIATKGNPTKPMTKTILVNNEQYTKYLDAYIDIDEIIEDHVKKMKKNEKYRKKLPIDDANTDI